MKWIYLMIWTAVAVREVPQLWRSGRRKTLALWLTAAGIGLALGLWYFWGNTDWRLAERVLGINSPIG